MDKVLDQFLTMKLLKDFDWPLDFTYSEAAQRDLVENVLKHPVSVRYPPSRSYRARFLKILIEKVEAEGEEVIDDIYELYAALLATPRNGGGEDDAVCYKSYHLSGLNYVSLKESTQMISNGTTGLITWPAAHYFMEWCLENQHIFKDRHILELGSGAGLAGIAICRSCGPASYCFTDCHEAVVHQLRENIRINIPQGLSSLQTQVLQLNWSDVEALSLGRTKVDIIVATDVVYDIDIIDALIGTLVHLFRLYPDVVCYIASCVRKQETYNYFTAKLAEVLIIPEPQKPPLNNTGRNQSIALVRLTPNYSTTQLSV